MILTISPSSLETLNECPTKYNFSSIRRLRLIEEKRDKMDRGSLFHEMLELHYKMQMESVPLNEIVMTVTELARQKYANDEYDDINMIEHCVENYQAYAMYYDSDGWTAIAVETPFTRILFESDEDKIVMEGKIDLIARNISGQTFPIDHKTSDKKDMYPSILSNQFLCYAWATESNLIVKNDIGFQKTYGPAERFHRHVLNYTKEHINEWQENTIYHGLKLINYIREERFPKNYSSCWRCRYRPICESTPDSREWKISSKFIVGDPFDIYAGK